MIKEMQNVLLISAGPASISEHPVLHQITNNDSPSILFLFAYHIIYNIYLILLMHKNIKLINQWACLVFSGVILGLDSLLLGL